MPWELTVYILGTAADIASTLWFLKRGHKEGNPIWSHFIDRFNGRAAMAIRWLAGLAFALILLDHGLYECLAWGGLFFFLIAAINIKGTIDRGG